MDTFTNKSVVKDIKQFKDVTGDKQDFNLSNQRVPKHVTTVAPEICSTAQSRGRSIRE